MGIIPSLPCGINEDWHLGRSIWCLTGLAPGRVTKLVWCWWDLWPILVLLWVDVWIVCLGDSTPGGTPVTSAANDDHSDAWIQQGVKMHRGLEREERVTAGSVLYLLPFSLWRAGWSLLRRNAGCCSYCVFVFAGYGRDKSSALLVWLSSFGRILTNEVCTAELWSLCG